MKRFTMFMIATLMAISAIVGQNPVGFTISDGSNWIEGASISFNNETLSTDVNGFVEFLNVNDGVDIPYSITASGFLNVNGVVTVSGARVDVPTIAMQATKDFAFVIYDSSIPAGPMGGNELDGVTVELTDGTNTYSATSAMGGFADFTQVLYGTYDYTVSMPGYISVSGQFTVEASTMGGEMITLDPYKDFAFVIYDSSIPAGPMGGNELDGVTVELTDGTNTYSATSAMGGFADFTQVLYGTYDYTVSMPGYISVSGQFTVDASTMGGEMITLDPYKDFAFVIYDSSIPAGPMGGNELDGVTVELTDGTNTYSATSAMGGFADFTQVLYGTYDYTVSMPGYISVSGQFTVDASTMGGEMITLDPYKDFAFVIYDSSIPAGPMGGNELDGVTVELTDGTNTYSATSAMGGFADFTQVLYGTYDYTVSMPGYISVSGQFTVDASTMGGEMITLDPYKDFAFVIYDSSIPAGPMGGNELDGVTVELTDGTNTYSATSTMGGFADFTQVLYGTYDYTVSMPGYISVSGQFTVDASTMGGEMITLDPYKDFAFVIYDSSIPAGPMGGNELDGVTVELTDGINTYSATSAMGGFADFTQVLYGTYDYTVSMPGYITVSGQFTVDASTMGGEMITLDPYKDFAFVIYDSSIPAGPMGGNELDGVTVELTDGTNTYSATSAMGGFADFTQVLYGTYDYTVSMPGYISVSGQFTVDASTMGGEMIMLDPIATSIDRNDASAFSVYPNPATSFVNVELGAFDKTLLVTLINSSGFIINQQAANESIVKIDLNGLSNGIYFIKINGDGIDKTIKFIKK